MLSASSMRMRRAYTVGFCIIVLILLFDTRILIQERNQGKGRYIYTTMPGIFKTSDEEMNHEKYDFVSRPRSSCCCIEPHCAAM